MGQWEWKYGCFSGVQRHKVLLFRFQVKFVCTYVYSSHIFLSERKRKRSDSVLWQKPLHRQNVTHKTPPKLRLHNDCGLRTVSWANVSQRTGVVKPVNGIPALPLSSCVIKGTNMHVLFYSLLKVETYSPERKYYWKWNNCVTKPEEHPLP